VYDRDPVRPSPGVTVANGPREVRELNPFGYLILFDYYVVVAEAVEFTEIYGRHKVNF
jgi:hypothetical protein